MIVITKESRNFEKKNRPFIHYASDAISIKNEPPRASSIVSFTIISQHQIFPSASAESEQTATTTTAESPSMSNIRQLSTRSEKLSEQLNRLDEESKLVALLKSSVDLDQLERKLNSSSLATSHVPSEVRQRKHPRLQQVAFTWAVARRVWRELVICNGRKQVNEAESAGIGGSHTEANRIQLSNGKD